MTSSASTFIKLDEEWGAHKYHPLPVVISGAEGAWVSDVEGNRYLDFLSGYSALNFGHRHPALIKAAHDQLDRLTLTSRAFHNDQFGLFCRELAELTGTEMVLTMNTGAEAGTAPRTRLTNKAMPTVAKTLNITTSISQSQSDSGGGRADART